MNTLILWAVVSCYGLSGPDQRAYCEALEHQAIGECYTIYNQSLLTACRAEVQEIPSICEGFVDKKARKLCINRASSGI